MEENDGISLEKYAELSAKLDPFEEDERKQKEIISAEGLTWEDWEFYKGVWAVEVLSNPDRIETFAKIYAKFSKND